MFRGQNNFMFGTPSHRPARLPDLLLEPGMSDQPLAKPERRILIVEDDPGIRELLDLALSRRSFSCHCTNNGKEAIDLLSLDETYDVILLDLMLPVVSGLDVIAYLKVTRPESLGRVIVVTAASKATLKAFGDLSRIRRLLWKPFDLMDLVEEVEGCADGRPKKAARPAGRRPEPILLD
jgi:DNA-binding response OmpR family regulator